MQNGDYQWNGAPSPAFGCQKSPYHGYHTSLTDLFLKKSPIHSFSTSGATQLGPSQSYLEKMLTMGSSRCASSSGSSFISNEESSSPSDVIISHSPHLSSNNSGVNIVTLPKSSVSDPNDPFTREYYQHNSPIYVNKLSDTVTYSNRTMINDNSKIPTDGTHLHLNNTLSRVTYYQKQNQNRRVSRARNPNNKQYPCPMCNKLFAQKGNLKVHMKIHNGDRPFVCEICGKTFTQKGNVETHMKIHSGERDYGCDLCGKTFTQKVNLKAHVRSVHTKERPFACNICGKSFSQKGNMKTHIRTHNSTERFPCNVCGKTFSQKGNLKIHMHRHAGTIPAHRNGQRRPVSDTRMLQMY